MPEAKRIWGRIGLGALALGSGLSIAEADGLYFTPQTIHAVLGLNVSSEIAIILTPLFGAIIGGVIGLISSFKK